MADPTGITVRVEQEATDGWLHAMVAPLHVCQTRSKCLIFCARVTAQYCIKTVNRLGSVEPSRDSVVTMVPEVCVSRLLHYEELKT